MLTVPEAARRIRKNPETLRRWIREGKLPAKKIGTQHLIDERSLDAFDEPHSLPVPPEWKRTHTGEPHLDYVRLIRRSRLGH